MFTPNLSVILLFYFLLASVSGEKNSTDLPENKTLTTITSDEYFEGLFDANEFEGHWVSDSDNLIRLKSHTNVVFYDVLTGKNRTVLEFHDVTEEWDIEVVDAIFSKDRTLALLQGTPEKNWKPVPCAKYLLCEVSTRRCSELGRSTVDSNGNTIQECIQLVSWAPEQYGLAYVANNNIYHIANARNCSNAIRQITQDGCEENGIYNGVSNWINGHSTDTPEEDVVALWFSDNGTHLTFYKRDESQVQEVQWPIYGYGNDLTEIRKVKYSKPGDNYTKSELHIVDLESIHGKPRKLKFAETEQSIIHTKGTPVWVTDSKFILTTQNRQSTSLAVHVCYAKSAICKQIHSHSMDHGWIDNAVLDVSTDGKRYILDRVLKEENETWSYNRIVLHKFSDPSETVVLTGGNMSVIEYVGWDDEKQKVYFIGTFWNGTVADPSETHLYYVSEDAKKILHCITCGLKNGAGELCRSNSAKVSGNFTHFIHHCKGPGIPETTTRYLNETSMQIKYPGPTLVNNSQARQNLKQKLRPIVKEYLIPIHEGFQARAKLLIPRNFNSSQKYPLLVNVYAGPGSQSISQDYSMSWEETMASDKNVIVAYIDGRGSGRQSAEQMFAVHRKLGTVEIEDQIAVTKWLIKNEPIIDANKTSIWGWSYGGYATIKTLETDTDNVFKCGVAVAPVTNWKHYNDAYTETYLGIPNDNQDGYHNGDVTQDSQVENLKNKELLLVHGAADHRVLYEHSMFLARSLQQNGILFHQLTYPDEGHSFAWASHKHVFKSIERFLFRTCYKQL